MNLPQYNPVCIDAAAFPDSASEDVLERFEKTAAALHRVRDGVNTVIFGQNTVIDQTLITLLAGGHALLVGVPGLGKTRLVQTLGHVLGLNEKRVQFTPDLMPSDILGSEVLEENSDGRRSFRFIHGPVFCQLLMADEINRASPRTQSALLQAMQEREVSVAGHHHPLPDPFHVLATQNPIEQEGTYPLPEAQLDRFLMEIRVAYPDRKAEREILLSTTGADEARIGPVMSVQELVEAQSFLRHMPVGESVLEAILTLTRLCRPGESPLQSVKDHVAWGPGPRAGQAFMLAVRGRALLDGRIAPSPEDVAALARPILRHRMALSFAARAHGVTVETVIDEVAATLEA